MNRRFIFLFIVTACVALVPFRSPAPLVYAPGEGWYYEPFGEKADWQRARAKDQLDVAEQAFTNRDYSITLHAAHRVLKMWPLSDYAPRAEYLIGRCLEANGKDEAAFNAYQTILEKYPKSDQFEDVLWRQYAIGGRFLGGEWFKLWNYIPFFPSMDKTAEMFDKIVKNGPYSDVAPHAQLRIGAAREKQKDYPDAVKAYETAADRYHDQPDIAVRRAVPRRHRVSKTGRDRRIRPGHRGTGHRRLHGFHHDLSRTTSACRRRKKPSPRSKSSRCAAISKSRNITRRARTMDGRGGLLQRSVAARSEFTLRRAGAPAHPGAQTARAGASRQLKCAR